MTNKFIMQEEALSSYIGSMLGVSTNDKEGNESAQLTEQELLQKNICIKVTNEEGFEEEKELKPRVLPFTRTVDLLNDKSPQAALKNQSEGSHKKLHSGDISVANTDLQTIELTSLLSENASFREIQSVEQKQQLIENKSLLNEVEKQLEINQGLKQKLQQSKRDIEDLKHPVIPTNTPKWAIPTFQVITLSIGKINIALPMQEFSQLFSLDKKAKIIAPDHGVFDDSLLNDSFLMGHLIYEGININLIDSLKMINPSSKAKRGNKHQYVLMIDSISDKKLSKESTIWGLVCDEVIGVETFSYDDLIWKTESTSRRWLYGTIKEKKCVLLDADELSFFLSQSLNVGLKHKQVKTYLNDSINDESLKVANQNY